MLSCLLRLWVIIGLFVLPVLTNGMDVGSHLSDTHLSASHDHDGDAPSLHAADGATADHGHLPHHHHADYHRAFTSLDIPAPSLSSRAVVSWRNVGYADHIPGPLPEPPLPV